MLSLYNCLRYHAESMKNQKAWINVLYGMGCMGECETEDLIACQQSTEQKLVRLLGLRMEIVKELDVIDFEIPLFRLQPPGTKNSEVSFEEIESKTKGGWSIFLEIPGYAIGADLSLRMEASGKIYASEDICKVIYLPVRIKRYLINLYWGTVCIAREKLIAEAGNKKTGQVYRRTIQSCTENVPPASNAPLLAEYNLSADLTSKNSEFKLKWGEGNNAPQSSLSRSRE